MAFKTADGAITFPDEPQIGRGLGATRLHEGVTLFEVTLAVAVLVQDVVEFVTVTVYVPDELTVGFAVNPPETMPGPAQLKFVPEVEVADKIVVVIVQVIEPPVALAPGALVSSETSAMLLAEHPPDDVVTVTVYTPEAFTVGF